MHTREEKLQAFGRLLDFLNTEEQKAAAEDEPQDEGDDTTGIKPSVRYR